MTQQNEQPTRLMQVAYGTGGVANGIFSNGLSFFLLLYYNLVIGMPAEMVGLALSIALIFDAVSDPVVGYLSDNWRSKSGKRHPFVYLSIIPVAFLFWLIWNPMDSLQTQNEQFWFLLITTIALRLSMTLYDVPHNAMVPELTRNYNGRTLLAGNKVSTQWIAGQVMVILMYMVWLVPTSDMPYGIMNQAGYQEAGLVGAIVIGVTILVSAIGLRPWQHRMTEIAHEPTKGPRGFFGQFSAAAGLPALRAIFFSSAFYAVAAGLGAALWSYIMTFFWELTNEQIVMILIANLVGAMLAGLMVKRLSRRDDKKETTIKLSILSTVIAAAPYLLRQVDLFPANGTDLLFYILFIHGIIQVGVIVLNSSMMSSMTADVVEYGLHRNGFQNEGIITAAITFVLKAGTAGGLAVSGLFLAFVGFPAQPDATNLTPEVVNALGINYAWLSMIIYLISLAFLTLYRIDKASFETLVTSRSSS